MDRTPQDRGTVFTMTTREDSELTLLWTVDRPSMNPAIESDLQDAYFANRPGKIGSGRQLLAKPEAHPASMLLRSLLF